MTSYSVYYVVLAYSNDKKYRTGGNFRGVLIFVDFVGPTQTTKNALKISADPRKNSFLNWA